MRRWRTRVNTASRGAFDCTLINFELLRKIQNKFNSNTYVLSPLPRSRAADADVRVVMTRTQFVPAAFISPIEYHTFETAQINLTWHFGFR